MVSNAFTFKNSKFISKYAVKSDSKNGSETEAATEKGNPKTVMSPDSPISTYSILLAILIHLLILEHLSLNMVFGKQRKNWKSPTNVYLKYVSGYNSQLPVNQPMKIWGFIRSLYWNL